MSDRQTVWERLLIGIAQAVIALMVIAVYTKLDDLGKSLAVVESQMADYRSSKEDYYTHQQAKARHEDIFRTNKHQYGMLEDHETRIRRIETR